ncbi:UDP-4-amino-4, 6-dideoxy-N-acetyl-beta-L-altrosamine N-acetyltransferase [Gammaproteobacteria bacterium]
MFEDQSVIRLVNLIGLDTETQIKVFEILRQDPSQSTKRRALNVNRYLRWVQHLKQGDQQIAFVVIDQEPLGLLNLENIDRVHKTADFYDCFSKETPDDLKTIVRYHGIQFSFEAFSLEKLHGTVSEENLFLLESYKTLSFQREGYRRSALLQDGRRLGTLLLGLTKEDWVAHTHQKSFLERFAVSVQWEKPVLHPIDQIEAARAKNNLNWMNVLRLALEKSPATAKPIIEEIKKIDREISNLTEQLTK